MSTINLSELRVLVTRPSDQAGTLSKAIRQAGGIAVPFPTITVEPAEYLDQAATRLSDLGEREAVDLLIFVSANAVRYSQMLLPPQGMAANPKIGAIGRATAAAAEAAGLSIDYCPAARANSSAFLALPEMQHVAGKKVLIVRGNSGLELLGDTLEQRGATVTYAEVYRRKLPEVPPGRFARLCESPGIDVVTATSATALRNLCTLANDQGLPKLLALPLIVVSDRVASVAAELGFSDRITVAGGADEAALLGALNDLSRSHTRPGV